MWSMPVLVGIFSPWRLLSTSLLSSYSTDSFLPLMNIFRSIARQTHPAVSFILSIYSQHRWPFMNPVCAVRVRMEKLCQASAEWRCAGVCALTHALYRSTCAGKMGYFSWLRLAEWGREQDFGIIAVQTESRMRGVSWFGSAGKQTVRWPQRLIVSFASIARVNRCTWTGLRLSCATRASSQRLNLLTTAH